MTVTPASMRVPALMCIPTPTGSRGILRKRAGTGTSRLRSTRQLLRRMWALTRTKRRIRRSRHTRCLPPEQGVFPDRRRHSNRDGQVNRRSMAVFAADSNAERFAVQQFQSFMRIVQPDMIRFAGIPFHSFPDLLELFFADADSAIDHEIFQDDVVADGRRLKIIVRTKPGIG